MDGLAELLPGSSVMRFCVGPNSNQLILNPSPRSVDSMRTPICVEFRQSVNQHAPMIAAMAAMLVTGLKRNRDELECLDFG